MIKIYQTPYGDVYIPVYAPKISVLCSGGFDSALLLYMVAKTCHEFNPTATIMPLTVVRATDDTDSEHRRRVDNLPIVDNIINYVRGKFPNLDIQDKKYKLAYKYWENGNKTYLEAQKNLIKENIDISLLDDLQEPYKYIQLNFNGVTKNPPVPMNFTADMHQFRELHRDTNCKKHQSISEGSASTSHLAGQRLLVEFIEAFRNADKRITITLAKQLGIFWDLNNMTRSCEGNHLDTNYWTTTCGKCWWCQERDWAVKEVYA
jgi:hypothetical protein